MQRTEALYNDNGLYAEGPTATSITADALNAIQEEIANVIEQAGFTLDSSKSDQLWTAISSLLSSGTSAEEITSDTTLNINKRYIVNATTKLNLTLPPVSPVGSILFIYDKGGNGFKIIQNSGNNILWMNQSTIPGATGYIETKTGYASMVLECVTADATWIVSRLRDVVQMKGYIMGGFIAAVTNVIEDLIFSNETSRAIAATLDTAKYAGAGVSSNLKGYIMGGFDVANTADIEDLIFSDESSQAIAATLDTAKRFGTGVSSNLKGYIMGGDTGAATADIEDLIFSDESSQAIVATLDTAKYDGTGVSSNLKGYIMGGNTGAVTAVIEDLIFSDETSQAIAATLDTAKSVGAGVSSNLKGYIMGGYTGAATAVIEDLIFSNETSQAIAATLDTAKYYGAGVQGYN